MFAIYKMFSDQDNKKFFSRVDSLNSIENTNLLAKELSREPGNETSAFYVVDEASNELVYKYVAGTAAW